MTNPDALLRALAGSVHPRRPARASLIWHTVRHLRPVQWRYRLLQTMRESLRQRFPARWRRSLLRRVPGVPEIRHPQHAVEWFHRAHDGSHGMFSTAEVLEGRFTFLNQGKQFGEGIEWLNPEFTYLWDFNLHYFEWLSALASQGEVKPAGETREAMAKALDSWIEANPCPSKPAWHPYPTSLRIINWVKSLRLHPELGSDVVHRSLYAQSLGLERNLEGHLMVNHFLENGRALLFAGLYFSGRDADRWVVRGLEILRQELTEEWLPRGGHFERSPMYHAILAEGLLDTHALLSAHDRPADWLAAPLRRMCEWLASVQTPDGWFPLFNDAAIGISASPDTILANASRLIGYERPSTTDPVRDCDGLWILEDDTFVCAVDGAPIGPDYNPGHAHADNLSFEAWYRGKKLVVDPGVYTYDSGPVRDWFRSSFSHNTVVINGLEQSETWGGFRVARRSHARSRACRKGELLVFQGEYSNATAREEGVRHERILALLPEGAMLIWDRIHARESIHAESTCQFAPEWTARKVGDGHLTLALGTGDELHLSTLDEGEVQTEAGVYSPEFGRAVAVSRVRMIRSGRRLLETGYLISTQAPAGATPTQVTRTPEGLEIQHGLKRYDIKLDALHPGH